MFTRRIKISLLVIGIILLFSVLGIWAFPRLVQALPGQIRARLPHTILQLVTTPPPAALPAPAVAAAPLRITIPPLASATPLPTETATPLAHMPTPASVQASPTAVLLITDTPSPTPTPTVTPIPPPPPSARIDGLEIIPQKFNNCGPTNLTINLNFYGHEVEQLEIAAVIKPHYDDRNVSPSDIQYYVQNYTPLQISVHVGGDLLLLKRLIAAGFPVVIEKGFLPSEWEGWMGHYLTVFGYNDAAQEFYALDTFLGPWDSSGLPVSYEETAAFWQHFNYTFFVVYPPEKTTDLQTILSLEIQDPLTMWQAAAHQAQQEIDTAPDNAFAWFNLGSSLTQLGHLTGEPDFYTQAAAAFDQARTLGLPWRMLWYQFDPFPAYLAVGRLEDVFTLAQATLGTSGGQSIEEAYLYQGHAFLAANNPTAAAAAYQNALEYNPHFTQAQAALDALP